MPVLEVSFYSEMKDSDTGVLVFVFIYFFFFFCIYAKSPIDINHICEIMPFSLKKIGYTMNF